MEILTKSVPYWEQSVEKRREKDWLIITLVTVDMGSVYEDSQLLP